MEVKALALFLIALPLTAFCEERIKNNAQSTDPLMQKLLTDRAGASEVPGSEGNAFLRSVARLRGELTCTTSFIHTSDSPEAPAYLLTNGHCAQDAFTSQSSNAIFLNKDLTEPFVAEFNIFHDTLSDTIPIKVVNVAYSTMKGTDIAILLTDKTIAQMRALQLIPFTLSASPLREDERIVVTGVPTAINVLTLSRCATGTKSDVVENYWHWFGFTSNSCEGISSGSSGGPVFNNSEPSEMVAVTNTTNVGAVGNTCYSGSPCAVGPAGAAIDHDKNYMAPVLGLSNCFDDAGLFNLERAGCPLPKPSGIKVSDYPYVYSGINYVTNQDWKFSVSASGNEVRTKTIQLSNATNSCTDIVGYGAPTRPADFNASPKQLPISLEGVHQYCVIDASNSTAENPEVVQVLIDNTAPTLEPPVAFIPFRQASELRVEPIFSLPEYTAYYLKVGQIERMNCDDQEGYKAYLRVPLYVELEPTTVCIYGFDYANNESRKFTINYIPTPP